MNGESIRPAGAGDWAAIERLLTDSNLPIAGARDHITGFVVAEHDGAVSGCAALERYGRAALLRSVAVERSRRGGGSGERLVRKLIDAARNEGLQSIVLLTTTAPGWFPRFGFRRIERDSVPADVLVSEEFQGACPASAVVMALDLRKR